MREFDQTVIDRIKARLAGSDPEALAYIHDLERLNDRLESQGSMHKDELGGLVDCANRWRIRSFVAEKISAFLNARDPWWFDEDLKREIDLQQHVLWQRWQKEGPKCLSEEDEVWGNFMSGVHPGRNYACHV